jgi:quercetin dioxygenase-like cupin family protein
VEGVSYKIDFDSIDWESPIPGMRQKAVRHGSKRVRLVEYSGDMVPHWCEKGHWGYIVEGRFEIEFDDGVHRYDAGDGVCIPSGAAHRHRGRVPAGVVRAIFVEDV